MPAFKDESVEAKWEEVKQYERDLELGITPGSGASSSLSSASMSSFQTDSSSNGSMSHKLPVTTKEKLKQMKKASSRKFMIVKNQLAGRYRKGELPGARVENYGEVSSSPTGGQEPRPSIMSMEGLGAMGRGIKSSKSLQNLEQLTKDGFRTVADKTSYIGQNIKHRCSSKVDINQLAPKRNYRELNDVESDDDMNGYGHQF